MLGFCLTCPQTMASMEGFTMQNFRSGKEIQLEENKKVKYKIFKSSLT